MSRILPQLRTGRSSWLMPLFLMGSLTLPGISLAQSNPLPAPDLAATVVPTHSLQDAAPGWQDAFSGDLGVNGAVLALEYDGTNLFVGGHFTEARGQPIPFLAMWDGDQMSPVGAGVDGPVTSFLRVGGDLYVGGLFEHAGDIRVNGIARWDGDSWHSMDTGVDGLSDGAGVFRIQEYNEDIYIGGQFSEASGNTASGVARWDGSNWLDVGGGFSEANPTTESLRVNELVRFSGKLVAAGTFSVAGGRRASHIAEWDGTSWSPLGDGVDGTVYDLAVIGDSALVASGAFEQAGNETALSVAVWEDGAWSPLGDGLNGPVQSLAQYKDELFAGGAFSRSGESAISSIARWDGTNWVSVGPGFGLRSTSVAEVLALAVAGSDLYAGGRFTESGDDPVSFLARWDGDQWRSLDRLQHGLNTFAYAATIFEGDLVVGGEFVAAGGKATSRIARWDGAQWMPMGDGLDGGAVRALVTFNDELYAGGYFDRSGDRPINRVARWNGTSWSPLGSGVDGTFPNTTPFIETMAVHDDQLYVGGAFTNAGDTPANFVARWTGTEWESLGLGVNSTVIAMETFEEDLFVGGTFTSAGGADAQFIARWNESGWTQVGPGLNGYVLSLEVFDDKLMVGGSFSQAGAVSARALAQWDGTSWTSPGFDFDRPVLTLTRFKDDLLAGGFFETIDDVEFGGLARFSDGSWDDMGGGTNGAVSAIVVRGDDVFSAGSFTRAGGQSALFVAHWTDSQVTGIEERDIDTFVHSLYPNPMSGLSTVSFTLQKPGPVSVTIADVMGREVGQVAQGFFPQGVSHLSFPTDQLSPGAYFVLVEAGEHIVSIPTIHR